ncbi:MAG: LysM peptidoglycan-binding domain-containing protein [Kiritimatiellaeota bacterium]|nr:LysM peptidoglycan-binding domain-containing protein [Kiritimatiellota bacterium]
MRRRRTRSNLLWVMLPACATLLPACNRSRALVDERNPYYVRGLQLRKQDRYAEAAEALEKCLRLSPASAGADLQLATLYEDHLDDPLRAVLHYRAYLTKRPKADNAALVRQWRSRAEVNLLRELAAQHPGVVPEQRPGGGPESAARITEREKRLAQRIKELNTEVLALRGELRMLTSATAAPTPRRQRTAPKPPGPTSPSAASTVPASEVRVYVVREGDTLSRISRKYYGTSRYWGKLRDANSAVLHGSDRLAPGMRLRLPPRSEIMKNP